MASRPGPIGEQRGQPDAHARLSKFLLQSQRLNQPIGLQETDMALGDAILVCLTDRRMTGYERAAVDQG